MKELSQITACFVDWEGLYLPLAKCLAETYDRVLYFESKQEGSPTIKDASIGDSFPHDEKLVRVQDVWAHKKECDLFVFPDSKDEGMQLELEAQGFPVWGSRRSISIEQSREKFIRILNELGLKVPPYERIIGLDRLREYLREKCDQIIKISRYRGTMETFKWRSWQEDQTWLDFKAVELGGLKNLLPFLVFESIETPFELGGDTYAVRGAFPELMLDGYEAKNKAYLATVKKRSEMPDQTQAILAAFEAVLTEADHTNFWSMELRVKGDDFYFIDPTPRGPSPALASQIAIYGNLPKIMAAGAEGELVEPEVQEPFVGEVALTIDLGRECNRSFSVEIPPHLKRFVKLSTCYEVYERTWFWPADPPAEHVGIGWLVAGGPSPAKVVQTLSDLISKLPSGIESDVLAIAELLKEIRQVESEGVAEFAEDHPLPEPEEVVQAD